MKSIKHQKGFTLVELLAVIALIGLLVLAFLSWRARGGKGAPPVPNKNSPSIPYPPPPTGTTSGASAISVAQGEFTDGHTTHGRLTTLRYTFHRYNHEYLQIDPTVDVEGVVFQVAISADAGDAPEISTVYGHSRSQILDSQNAIIVTDADGLAELDIYIPAGEFSNDNTLYITFEERDTDNNVVRRIQRADVTISAP